MDAIQKLCSEKIKKIQRVKDNLDHHIMELAEEFIEDYHFLDYKVSTFWTCEESPIGMCVFPLTEDGRIGDNCCRYCGEPNERK